MNNKKNFYLVLAATNVKKNSKAYLPYILTCILTIAMFYIICALAFNDDIGNGNLAIILRLGTIVTAFFAVMFLFYTNSFLIKGRKKEFGLLNILGMEKKHIFRIILWETIFVMGISLFLGLFFGLLLNKLVFLILFWLFQFEVTIGFYISWFSMGITCILFMGIFLLILLNCIRQIHLAKPAELLRGGAVGEKEPKTKWVMTVLGLFCLGGGYYISVFTENPLALLYLFLFAVLLVMIGTYLLFTAGSIALLKLLRKNKKYFYKTKHFISVSGMIYRMKQNAAGLSSICILSTMVLVMISSTLSLYLGMEDSINSKYMREFGMQVYSNDGTIRREFRDEILTLLSDEGLKPINELSFSSLTFVVYQAEDYFEINRGSIGSVMSDIDKIKAFHFITLNDYNAMEGESKTLQDDEILIYTCGKSYTKENLSLPGMNFYVKERLDEIIISKDIADPLVDTYAIIIKDEAVLYSLYELQKEVLAPDNYAVEYYYGFDLDLSDTEEFSFYEMLKTKTQSILHNQNCDYSVTIREAVRQDFLSLYGGLLFLGTFLGLLFTMATILIIYYKQVSEGYDDRERYQIMRKVGLSRGEIKKSIQSQILTVFFLPLIMAAVHIGFAFPAIKQILAALGLMNTSLFIACTIGSFLVFSLAYCMVYLLTAKVYYKLVN